MQIGARCNLYKTCKICGKTQHFTNFAQNGKRYRCRKSYCIACKERKHEKHKPEVSYSYNIFLLSEPSIKMRERNKNGRLRREKWVSLQYARKLVDGGAAAIVHETLIHRLYSSKQIRVFVFVRDQFTCHYCGRYGDTIDHIIPKSKGGITTPRNCVCACKRCNQLKDDRDVAEFLVGHHISNSGLKVATP